MGQGSKINLFGMPRMSLRFLFVFTLVCAIIIAIVAQRFRPMGYTGIVSEIGSGYSSSQLLVDSDGLPIGGVKINIDESLVSRQIAWENESPNPPLSARRVLQIADGFRMSRLREYKHFVWSLHSIRLAPMDIKSDKWIWIVCFEQKPKPGLTTNFFPTFEVYVLMDGTVIEPDDPDGFLSKAIDQQEKKMGPHNIDAGK
jgi:hypothetical protein